MRDGVGDIAAGVLLAALGAALFVVVPRQADTTEGAVLSSASLPMALAALIALLALILAGQGIWRWRRAAAPAGDGGDEEGGATARGRWAVVGTVAVTAAYVALIPRLGYLIATALALGALALLYGNRRWPSIAVTAAAVPPALFFFFERVMVVLLPRGPLLP